jgi:hypothetical protein
MGSILKKCKGVKDCEFEVDDASFDKDDNLVMAVEDEQINKCEEIFKDGE